MDELVQITHHKNGEQPVVAISDMTVGRFFQRFVGLTKGHGEYVLDGTTDARGKKGGKGETIHQPLDIERMRQHLEGTRHIGTCPIREDATCRWGAIDVDTYKDFDLFKLADHVAALELPLIPCRTKSGGAHLYIFTSEDVSAELMRTKLMEWAVALGYSGVEIYPKQTRLAGVADYGNWINLPYQNAALTERFGVLPNGKELVTVESFLDHADRMEVTLDRLIEIQPPQNQVFKGAFEDGPPCLQTLAVRGFEEGSRNNALYNICVLLRKKFGDDWEGKVDEMNQRFIYPALGHKEVQAIIKSVKKKDYFYKCNDIPIVNVCNRQICLTRKFGIGTHDNDPGVVFGPLVKMNSDPVIWFWDVNGRRIELSTSELKDQMRFHTRAIDELNIWPKWIKPQDWARIVRERLEKVEIIEAPPEARPEGQIWAHLEQYLVSRPQARTREELLQNKPWTDPDTNLTHFRANHFHNYLEQQRVKIAASKLWSILRAKGADHPPPHNIKGRLVQVWTVDRFATQDSDFTVPRLTEEV